MQAYQRGLALQKRGKGAEAASSYAEAVALAPGMADAHFRLGQIHLAGGDALKAKSFFLAALAANPTFSDANVGLAMISQREGLAGEAQAQLREAIRADPNNLLATGLLAARLQEAGEFDQAEKLFLRAIEMDPNAFGPYFGIVKGRKMTPVDAPIIAGMQRVLGGSALTPEERVLLLYSAGKAKQDLHDFEAAMGYFDEGNRLAESLKRITFDRAKYSAHFDRLIETFGESFLNRYSSIGSTNDSPIFIVGMIRSGTTLVEQILSSHPEIGAGGELTFLIEKSRTLLQRAIHGRFDVPLARQLTADYLDMLGRTAPDKRRVTDKLPNNYEMLGLIRVLLPKANIVFCRRNAVDNCLSIYTTPYIQGAPEYAHNRGDIVFAYREHLRLMEHWTKTLPEGQILVVNYEDVVQDRERIARQLISFVGLEWDDSCLQHEKNERVVKTPSMWQVRQPIYNTSVGRWRNYERWLGDFQSLL